MKDAQDGGRSGRLSLIIRVGVATAAILWVCRNQDWGELAAVFRRLSAWYFCLTAVIYAGTQVILAVRWWLLLRAQSIYLDVRTAIRLFFLGLFYNNVMLGAVGGDVVKAWYVAKHTDKRLEGVLSVFVDRVVGLVGLIVMAVVAYLVFVRGPLVGPAEGQGAGSPSGLAQYQGVILWSGVAVAAALAVVLIHPYGRRKLRQAARGLRRRGMTLLAGVKDALVVYCSKPMVVFLALILTFISQSIVIVSFWGLGRNLGIEAGPKYYFVIFPVMWVAAAVPVSIAGLGILEAGTVGLFTFLAGTAGEKALALAFCQRSVWVLTSLPGGLVHLLGAHLPREISVDDEKGAT